MRCALADGSTESDPTGSDDDEVAGKAIAGLIDQIDHGFWQWFAEACRVSNQNYSARRLQVCIDQLAEVLVFGEQYSSFPYGDVDDLSIV